MKPREPMRSSKQHIARYWQESRANPKPSQKLKPLKEPGSPTATPISKPATRRRQSHRIRIHLSSRRQSPSSQAHAAPGRRPRRHASALHSQIGFQSRMLQSSTRSETELQTEGGIY